MLMANRGNELGIRNLLLTSTPWAKKRNINVHPFQIAVYFSLFFHCFLIKFLKRYLLSGCIAGINLLVACFN